MDRKRGRRAACGPCCMPMRSLTCVAMHALYVRVRTIVTFVVGLRSYALRGCSVLLRGALCLRPRPLRHSTSMMRTAGGIKRCPAFCVRHQRAPARACARAVCPWNLHLRLTCLSVCVRPAALDCPSLTTALACAGLRPTRGILRRDVHVLVSGFQ